MYRRLAMKLMKRVHRYIAEKLAATRSCRSVVLDVGCGTGDLLIQLARYAQVNYLLCLDISKAMVGIAREEFEAHGVAHLVDTVLGDAHYLPFRAQSIDLIVSVGTLHHLKDVGKFLRECGFISRGMCISYELSHDVSLEDVETFRKAIGTRFPVAWLKLVASLHGIPRRDFLEGQLRDILQKLDLSYTIKALGLLTSVIIAKQSLGNRHEFRGHTFAVSISTRAQLV